MRVEKIYQIGKRSYQEDSYYIDPKHRYFIVADGVGGAEAGDVASQTIIDASRKWLDEKYAATIAEMDWVKLAEQMYEALVEVAEAGTKMGTTCVAFVRHQDKWYTIHVGDSRLYLIRPKRKSFWKTKDHSLVQELFDSGVIKSQIAMETHPKSNVITRAFLSDREAPTFDVQQLPSLHQGDFIVLGSDGLFEPFPVDAVVDVFMDEQSGLQEKVEYIAEECGSKSKDNNTGIFIQLESDYENDLQVDNFWIEREEQKVVVLNDDLEEVDDAEHSNNNDEDDARNSESQPSDTRLEGGADALKKDEGQIHEKKDSLITRILNKFRSL